MHNELLARYEELDASLKSLPEEIYQAEQDVNFQRRHVAQAQAALDSVEAELILNVEGRNAEQRAANLTIKKTVDLTYIKTEKTLEVEEDRLAEHIAYHNRLQTQFAAVKHRSRMLAAMLVLIANGHDLSGEHAIPTLTGEDIGL